MTDLICSIKKICGQAGLGERVSVPGLTHSNVHEDRMDVEE